MLMADFVTAVKYKLPIKVVIIKNNTLGQIKWEQMVFLGNPEYGVDLHPIDFAAFGNIGPAGGVVPLAVDFESRDQHLDRDDGAVGPPHVERHDASDDAIAGLREIKDHINVH